MALFHDMPDDCAACVFSRKRDPDLLCHGHAPGTGREAYEITHWPVVNPADRCGHGSLGLPLNPKKPDVFRKLTRCEVCVHWRQPKGGIKPDFALDRSDRWWEGAGFCLIRAPLPSTEPDTQTYWRVTHYTDACGDGQDIA